MRLALSALVVLGTLAAPAAPWPLGVSPALASPAAVIDQSRESVLVTGRGEVFGAPDTLIAEFAVEAGAATVAEAMTAATAAGTRMRDALVGAGVARPDLQTSDVSVTARRNDKGEITGYTVTQGLTAKVRDLAKPGPLLSAAIAAGGNAARLNGVSFTIDDNAALLAEARRKAFADARRKAELYAQAAARPLARVIRVSEETTGYADPGTPDRVYAAADAAASIPIEPGRRRVTATVTVEWAFGPTKPKL
ncbi:SIMPL domain-containing protein [Actinoplanes sp. NPDC049596]|uniref:SIMPL domain-containing protein n=1 Tax=unclassified Actinoplanes TaxID=2626549 RepID=UPI003445DF49